MATFSITSGAADFDNPIYDDVFFNGTYGTNTTSLITLTYNGYTLEIAGTFSLSGNNPVSGPITSWTLQDSGGTISQITSLAIDWTDVSGFLSGTDTAGLQGALFVNGDTINGSANADTLKGDAGNDSLFGNAGNDTLYGGDGNDSYSVDNTADVITENVGEGTDLVYTQVTYTLGANVKTCR
jgi:Ca2+-binding RTX toxin-like protein